NLESAHLISVSRVTVLTKSVQLPIDDERPAARPCRTQVFLDDRAERMFGPRPLEIGCIEQPQRLVSGADGKHPPHVLVTHQSRADKMVPFDQVSFVFPLIRKRG